MTNGNQLRLVEPQGTTVFTYNEENRLTGIGFPTGTSVEYQYDGQGRRLRMKDPNVEVFSQYGMGQVISDRDGAGAVIAYYVRGIGGRLISNVQTAGTRYYHFDGLGSVVALTDSAGAKVSSYTYDEFGVLKQSTGQSWNNFEYTSSIHDASPGLYLMGARYYNPALGRFITQDTWGGNAYEPWTKNLYAYGRGNPVNYIDPTGHAGILPDGSIYAETWVDRRLLDLKLEYENATSVEKRAEIAELAADLRESYPDLWTVGADMSLGFCRIPDITASLDYLMQSNEAEFAEHRGDYLWFAEQVNYHQTFDLKDWDEFQHSNFVYRGQVLRQDAPANILFGYLGTAAGFSPFTLRVFACVAQQLYPGDQPVDGRWIWTDFGDAPGDWELILIGIQRWREDWMEPPSDQERFVP